MVNWRNLPFDVAHGTQSRQGRSTGWQQDFPRPEIFGLSAGDKNPGRMETHRHFQKHHGNCCNLSFDAAHRIFCRNVSWPTCCYIGVVQRKPTCALRYWILGILKQSLYIRLATLKTLGTDPVISSHIPQRMVVSTLQWFQRKSWSWLYLLTSHPANWSTSANSQKKLKELSWGAGLAHIQQI